MKIVLSEGSVTIKYLETGKKVQVKNSEISAHLSEGGQSMETVIFLMRLPYIKEILYSQNEKTVSYDFYAGSFQKNIETIYGGDENIIKLLEWCEGKN